MEKVLHAAGSSLESIILRYLVKLETHIARYPSESTSKQQTLEKYLHMCTRRHLLLSQPRCV